MRNKLKLSLIAIATIVAGNTNAQTFYQCIPDSLPSSCPKGTTEYMGYCFFDECEQMTFAIYRKTGNDRITPKSKYGVSATYVKTDYSNGRTRYQTLTDSTVFTANIDTYTIKMKFKDCIYHSNLQSNSNIIVISQSCCAKPLTPIADGDISRIMSSFHG